MNFDFLIYFLITLFILKFLIKKLKKYIKIYKFNGFDGVYYYFINKNFKKTGLSNFIDKKKNILGKKIGKLSKGKILYGPYNGTRIINEHGWSNTDLAAKYLGTYELQIQREIISLSKKFKLNTFVDLGAAEGFHIISLLKKKYFKKGFAFEIEKKSRILLKKNALKNSVSKKLKIFNEANFHSLKKNLFNINQKKTLFLVDIEGNEYSLFSKDFCNYFAKSFFIIEDHCFNIKNNNLVKVFKKNINKRFNVKVINDISKNPFIFKILKNFNDDEKYLMMSEGRLKTMQWIILYPNN